MPTVIVDTGSGRVEIESPARRLSRVEADTGSGDVRLRLGDEASFEARADESDRPETRSP